MKDELDYQSILVAVDFSPSSEAALKQAIWLSRQSGASLVLEHILPESQRAVHSSSYMAKIDLLSGHGERFEREIRQDSESKMRCMLKGLDVSGLEVKLETRLGEVFVEVTHAVQHDGYDLVLAGTRGHNDWKHFFVGSTAKRLIRKCPSSVWIVKAEHVGPPGIILAPTDFSDVSRKAIFEALRLAKHADSELHLLHVIDSNDIQHDDTDENSHAARSRHEVNEIASKRLVEFLKSFEMDRSRIHSHLSFGTPWKEICQMVGHHKVDLIAMGTVGRSGVKGLFLGSTAEKVLDNCDCSILTTKPDGFVSPIEPLIKATIAS